VIRRTRSGPRLRVRDLLAETGASLAASPNRTVGAGLGVVLASAAFVATYGLAATLSQQVSDAFDAGRATEVLVTRPSDVATPALRTLCDSPPVDETRRLSGVVHAGQYQFLSGMQVGRGVGSTYETVVPIVGVDDESALALDPHLVAGRLLDAGHVRRHDRVAVIPRRLSEQLGLGADPLGQAVLVDQHAVTVIGVFDGLTRQPDALGAVLLPFTTNSDLFAGVTQRDQVKCSVVVQTRPGAASPLAAQVALALDPADPDGLTVIAPPDPQAFRQQLERPVRLLSLALTIAAMLVGALSIASSMSNSVATRIGEIGLRKALGARSRHILAQFVFEAATVGLVGSILGVFVGAYGVIAVSLANHWSPILDLRAAIAAAAFGSVVGAVAGLLPAYRAARVAPVDSLRR